LRVAINITTCRRPEMLAQLLDDIKRWLPPEWTAWIHVVEDDYGDARYPAKLVRRADKWTQVKKVGAAYYVQIIGLMWEEAYKVEWDRMLQLPDDVRLARDFFHRVEKVWQSIDDPRKACLSPMRDHRTVCWTGWEMMDVGPVMLSQWNDLAIWADRGFLDAVLPMPRKVQRRAESSGVGAWVSRKLHAEGYRMYHVKQTLIHHGDHASVMHPTHRREVPIVV
jgi:hypothetical protein